MFILNINYYEVDSLMTILHLVPSDPIDFGMSWSSNMTYVVVYPTGGPPKQKN